MRTLRYSCKVLPCGRGWRDNQHWFQMAVVSKCAVSVPYASSQYAPIRAFSLLA